MYNVYFDNILQDAKDIININDSFETSIVREDGFSGTEQIIREKSETLLQFTGQAYKYVNSIMKENPCAEIQFKIEDSECGYIYNGIIPVTSVELSPSKYIGKTTIKDNSFSAYIREYLGVDVYLGATSTIGCETLALTRKEFVLNKVHNTDLSADEIVIYGFDVLDVFKYMVWYFTNNSINVESDYLTTNKYAITTGFNMHNFAFSDMDLYPKITMQELFTELRKKFNLYMGIEYDAFNNPYLRIEQESYFFLDGYELFAIDYIPKDTKQEYDIKRNFNIISIGSKTYKTEDPANEFYNENRQDGWIDSKYTSCGTCTGLKDSKLDLVSEYIISSNIIYEAINAGTNDYANDDKTFLFNYEVSGVTNTVKRDLIDAEYVYNINLINSSVLQNHIDYYSNCIAVSRYPLNGFLIQKSTTEIDGIFPTPIDFNITVYDDNTVTDFYSGTPNWTLPPNIIFAIDSINNQPFQFFKSPITADYNLKASVSKLYRTNDFNSGSTDIQLQIITYTDDTFSTYIDVFQTTITSADGLSDPVSLSLETGEITINTGECALVVVSIKQSNSPYSGTFQAYLATFEMLSDGTCISINENNQNSKPYQVYFDYPLCYSDYLKAINNKGGYITIKNNKYWIKELIYRHKKLSGFILIGNDSF